MRISDWSSDVCSSDLSNSAINGSGIAVTVGAWADGLLFRNLSLGLEYLHMENSADLDLTVRALGKTVSVGSGADLAMDALMMNAAWRQNSGTSHHYVALGAAAVRTTGSRSEEHTSEIQSRMRNPYAVFYMKTK